MKAAYGFVAMRIWVIGIVVAIAVATSVGAQQAPAPALADLLRLGASYAATYATKMSGVTLEEQLLLVDVSGRIMTAPQRITSDVVLLRISADGDVVGVRDAFAIDNRALRPRQPRIVNTLAEPTLANWEKVQAYARENAILLVANVVLWFSDPTLALRFIAESNQRRITYKLEGTKRVNGVQVQGVAFKETEVPNRTYLLETPGNPLASGRIWMDPATGAIHMTELWVQSTEDTARIQVTYAADAKLGLLLPRDATHTFENKEPGSGGTIGTMSSKMTIEGTARYTNPRYTPLDLGRIVR